VIAPCNCKGTSKYVHEHCLQQWRRSQRRFRCEICHSQYHLKQHFLYHSTTRLGCFIVVLLYGYTILLSLRFLLSFVSLTPTYSRLEYYRYEIKTGEWIQVLFRYLSFCGPGVLVVAPSVQAKRNKVSRWTYRYVILWILTFHVAFISPWIALVSDLLFISLSCIGIGRIMYDSWFTSALLSPTVNVILVDLNSDANLM
jgi:E3 ubiquitin-protein ligase DOA10